MKYFNAETYLKIICEIRDRIHTAESLSEVENLVFIESTSLQIRKVLELVAYLSILVNGDKLNSKERNEYHAKKIVELLNEKTTIFYPFPSCVIEKSDGKEKNIIPLFHESSLSQVEFKEAYQLCGKVLHAQHPLKTKVNFQDIKRKNHNYLQRLKSLMTQHTIPVKRPNGVYTFLYVKVDFSERSNPKYPFIREFSADVSSEEQLVEIFSWE
ncbi:hypothetical protein [Vibrio cholerae]|uniref:hypothetical protein n=2 Tax=Vibrio cholerae TaxID=666 RepID=UPI00166AC8AF|nr:hypothetical protein [Vibrio cholerae]EIK2268851.1 hypothetical protein [Vibrio cholerae]EJL6271653.1 hypothetical protein [Vibrio cholerae]EJL6919747.1 hypothetical protein [Vibrio cholerae]GFK35454.1 hypothetical protein VcPa01_03649 [Vibrio cholerae]GFK38950.1 hypothetical protein VcPa02_03592 [Vibrio cholerae]